MMDRATIAVLGLAVLGLILDRVRLVRGYERRIDDRAERERELNERHHVY